MASNEKKRKIPNMFKSKLFIASVVFYLLTPLIFVFVYFINVPQRTSGEYYYYEKGVLSSKIVLTADNKVELYFYDGDYYTDKEYINKNYVKTWSYRESAWKDNYDPEVYKYLSLEYIRFGGDTSEAYFIYFKIGNKLYSDFLIDESRGGGQKCYTKK